MREIPARCLSEPDSLLPRNQAVGGVLGTRSIFGAFERKGVPVNRYGCRGEDPYDAFRFRYVFASSRKIPIC